MGYYDEHYSQSQSRQGRTKRGGFLSAFIGAVVGGLVVLFSIPLLSNLGLISQINESSDQEMIVSDGMPEDVQAISYSVNSDVTQAVDKVSDAVVGVINIQQSNPFSSQGGDEGTGSGVIYKATGDKAFVVTNHHVIERANDIEISLADGTRVPATLLGSDVITDLAVLEVDSSDIDTVAEFGNSDSLRVGEPAIAIGNPLGLRFSSSVTQGIISATERSIPVDLTGNGQVDWHAEVLQTDAAINPGNSGGALLNIEGQVIGINSMKIAQSSVEGIGFAIPTSVALPIIEDLERYGEVKRPQLGVGIQSLNEIPSYHWQKTLNLPREVNAGVLVSSIAPMSPAERAGLEQYDVIVAIDGEEIADGHDLRRFLYTEKQIGEEVEVSYYRNGSLQTTTVQLAEQQSF